MIGCPESLADTLSPGGGGSVFEIAVAAAIVLSGLTITYGSCVTLVVVHAARFEVPGLCVEDAERSVNHKTPSSQQR